MTKEQRHELIMEELIKHGSVLVADLVRQLDVSAVTIRKDLTELEKSDKLYRSITLAALYIIVVLVLVLLVSTGVTKLSDFIKTLPTFYKNTLEPYISQL